MTRIFLETAGMNRFINPFKAYWLIWDIQNAAVNNGIVLLL